MTDYFIAWIRANCSRTKRSSTYAVFRPTVTRAKVRSPSIATTSHIPSLHNSTAGASSIRAAICRASSNIPRRSSPRPTNGSRNTLSPSRSVGTMPMSRCYWRTVWPTNGFRSRLKMPATGIRKYCSDEAAPSLPYSDALQFQDMKKLSREEAKPSAAARMVDWNAERQDENKNLSATLKRFRKRRFGEHCRKAKPWSGLILRHWIIILIFPTCMMRFCVTQKTFISTHIA